MKRKTTPWPTGSARKWMPFLIWGRTLNKHSFFADLLAGLTGAIIVLPQGVAYALIAGLPAEYGLYTAIVTPVIAGIFGSSLHLISGPTAAISIVVLSVVSSVVPQGTDAFIPVVLTLTLLTGIIQLGMGLARMGILVNFISHTVVIGFTAGAAVLIATSQLKHALGIPVPSGSSFFESWQALLQGLSLINFYSVSIAVITIAATLFVKKVYPKMPAMLFGMIVGSVTCFLLSGEQHNVPLVGALSGRLPPLSLPDLSAGTISRILPGAIAIAILGLVEAVSIARAIAIRSGQRIDGNQEFIGQGLSNVVGSFFSCYPGSGSFTRSGVNYDAGAKTPLASIFAAMILVVIIVFVPQVTEYLPLPAMAGGILLISWNLIDTHHIGQILRSNKQEAAILSVTFFSTLIVELEFSIYLGVLLSLIFYLKRTANPRIMEVAPKTLDQGTDLRSISRFQLSECPQIKTVRIDGSIFFGAADHIQKTLIDTSTKIEANTHLILLCSGVNFIDVAGAEMLLQESSRMKKAGHHLHFCSLKNTVKDELSANNYLAKLGEDNFYPTIDEALTKLVPLLDQPKCQNCTRRVFSQCPPLP
ncbi:SulP family inorganic anion transporter [Marinomonas algicola]|uniref:SulP family inorganic anion transporter n=1 Tax=Marinomonas algicola TaxID=2773454 RepID=UPI00174D8512|nr:SulP family inorganic anion transporter [Marinomonas algicola]